MDPVSCARGSYGGGGSSGSGSISASLLRDMTAVTFHGARRYSVQYRWMEGKKMPMRVDCEKLC